MNAPAALALALGLSACASRNPPNPNTSDAAVAPDAPDVVVDEPITRLAHDDVVMEVQDSLNRLIALELIDVGQMLVDAPEGGQNCYGPCAEDPVTQAWMQEHARQAERLADLVERAEQVADAPAAPLDSADAALEALRALSIVEIGGIHYEGGGNCYIGYCPGDDEHRGRVQALAEAARDL